MLDDNLYTSYPSQGAFSVDDRHYDPDKPRIKDLLWNNYDWFVELDRSGKARPAVLDNVQRTLLCNTIYLGYDGFECPVCGNENLLFRKCHSRFCNSCGVKLQKQLAAKAEVMCVDVPHRHLVFTIPEPYRYWFRKDRSALNLLFVAARNTLAKIFNESIYRKLRRKRNKTGKVRNKKDNKYLYRNFSGQNIFGMIATLHTFGRDLKWNPHIHALVPELVWDPKKNHYKEVHYFDFASLRKTWQYELNRLLLEHFGRDFRTLNDSSFIQQDNGFYVYAKPPGKDNSTVSDHVAGCVNYMMRYAARPAMAESRISKYVKKTRTVTWFYDDHKTGDRITVTESDLDLLKKMIIHIPDRNFRMVRYYGFYNNKEQDLLDTIHEQLGQARKRSYTKERRKKLLQQKFRKLRFRTLCMDSYNRDVLRCKCGAKMQYVDSYNPLDGRSNDRLYRQECINEMRVLRLRRTGPS